MVSEPGNVLHPDEYAKRLANLKKDGLKMGVSVLEGKAIDKLRDMVDDGSYGRDFRPDPQSIEQLNS